jgi:hypothetical protein
MEMREVQIAKRHFAQRLGIAMDSMKSGQIDMFTEEDIRREIARLRTAAPYYFVEGRFRKSIRDVEALIHGLRPSILFVDGGYLIKAMRTSGVARWEQAAEVALGLKNISDDVGIPVVVTFQINRQGSKKAGLENIHLTDELGQLASLVISLEEVDDDEEITTANRRVMKVIGGREVEGGLDWHVNWDWRRMRFDEVSRRNRFERTITDNDEYPEGSDETSNS